MVISCRDCTRQTYTVNLNTGTTPFGVKCPHCKGLNALSNFYRIGPLQPQTEIVITHAFYRPTPERLAELNAEVAVQFPKAGPNIWDEHVLMGGLCFDKLGSYLPLVETEPPSEDFEKFQDWIYTIYGKRAKQQW